MINSINDNKQIESFYNMIPFFPYFIEDELAFTISNTETFLFVQESENLKMSSKAGDKIPPGCAAYECIKQKKPVSFVVPEHVFGISAKAIGIPIFENGNIAGAIIIGKSLNKKIKTSALSKNISDTLSHVNSTISEMASNMKDISKTNSDIQNFIEQTNKEAKETDSIIKFINSIADQTNLLGLNASIESARAGEYGRGFNVVSNEIRNLSQSSAKSIKQIDTVLKNIQNSIDAIQKRFNNSNIALEKQTLGVDTISANINELSSIANELKQFSEEL